jgi:SAM-dependent methyltransferase
MSQAFVSPRPAQGPWLDASHGPMTEGLEETAPGERDENGLRCRRDWIRRCYDGPAGIVLRIGSLLSLHEPLVGRLITSGDFGLSGCRSILDIGVGAGQILRHLLAGADPGARVTAIDLSTGMLQRTRRSLRSDRPTLLAADITRLPFADESFDCITCGWVLEYQADPRPALAELQRVLMPGGKLLVLATDDTPTGRMVGRLWSCRTYTVNVLRAACRDVGLRWRRRHWLSPVHRLLGAGGILFEATRPRLEVSTGRSVGASRAAR